MKRKQNIFQGSYWHGRSGSTENRPSERLTQRGDKIMETDSKIIGRDSVEWIHMAFSYGPVGGYSK
jgi:hypothetical protein